jgi:hypothetical protein
LTILALFGGLETFHEASELDLGEADKKKLDELDARLNVLEEKVKKLWLFEESQHRNGVSALWMSR